MRFATYRCDDCAKECTYDWTTGNKPTVPDKWYGRVNFHRCPECSTKHYEQSINAKNLRGPHGFCPRCFRCLSWPPRRNSHVHGYDIVDHDNYYCTEPLMGPINGAAELELTIVKAYATYLKLTDPEKFERHGSFAQGRHVPYDLPCLHMKQKTYDAFAPVALSLIEAWMT